MKPSILLFSALLIATGAATAGDSKALLQKALFAEEVEQDKAKAAEFYQRLIDQEGELPKQIAVARYHLAKLKLDAGKKDEANALLKALIDSSDAPAPLVAQAKALLPTRPGHAEMMNHPDAALMFDLLKGKLWDWHFGNDLYHGTVRGTYRFLADGKTEATCEVTVGAASAIVWRPLGGRRFRIDSITNGAYYIFEMSADGTEALALDLPGVADAKKRLCLHPTAARSIEEANIEFFKKILENPDKLAEGSLLGDLMETNNRKVIGFILDHGMAVNLPVKDGLRRPLLNLAVERWADLDIVKMLLDRGAEVDSTDVRNHTPLIAAAAFGRRDIAALLLERGASVGKVSTDTYNEWRNRSNLVRVVGTALHAASSRGDIPTIRLLLEHGADINVISGKEHATPLICAMDEMRLEAVTGYTPSRSPSISASAMDCMRLEAVKELLARGANPNLPEDGRVNPLRQMTHVGNVEIVRLLLSKGARYDLQSSVPVDQNDLNRPTGAALHTAAREGQLVVAQVLVEAGCPVDQATPQYLETPLHAAALHGNTAMCKWLLEKGANPQHRLADHVGLQSGWTPLHSAAWRGSLTVADLLIAKGASPADACGDAGMRRTAFHLAVMKGWIPLVQSMLAQPAYQTPEGRKQLLAITDLQGNTALHLAVSREAQASAEMVKLLVDSGAPRDIANARNLTPEQLSIDPALGARDETVRSMLRK